MCDLTFSAITFLLNKNTCGRFLFWGGGGRLAAAGALDYCLMTSRLPGAKVAD